MHDGSIIPDAPNRMWGTDATQVMTRHDGMVTVFVAVDHFVGDVVGVHAGRPGARFEALEPIHQGIREHFGVLNAGSLDTVEELRQALLEFKERFNQHWLPQRHRYATPAQVRTAYTHLPEAA